MEGLSLREALDHAVERLERSLADLRAAIDSATAWGDFFLLDALVHAVEPELRLHPLQLDRR